MNNHAAKLPDIEVRVTAGAFDCFIAAYYKGRGVHEPLEVVAFLAGTSDRRAVEQILLDALTVVRSQGWITVDELDAGSLEEEESPPF